LFGYVDHRFAFLQGQDSVKQYNSNASKTYDLKDNTIQISNHIARYHVTQDIPGIADAINSKLSHTANDALNDLKNSVNQSNSDPQVLGITNKSNGELVDGHTVVPYMVTDQGSGIFWIWVYDPNKPGTSNNHVIINTNINTWNYQGYYIIQRLRCDCCLPNFFIAQPNPYYRCPWCINNVAYPVYFAGLGDLLITDQSGNRLGFVNGVSYSEIPGAYINPPLDDLQSSPSQNLMLPSTNTYSIQILGNSQITGTSDTTISNLAPDFQHPWMICRFPLRPRMIW